MAGTDFRSLHDFTMLRIIVDWAKAEAKLELSGPGGEREMFARGLRHLSLAREQPWGPSVSVNRINVTADAASGLCSLEIEMQSGDPIKVVCESFGD